MCLSSWRDTTSSSTTEKKKSPGHDENRLIPAGLGGGDDIGGDVGDVVVREAAAEGGHGVLAVGDLGHHGLLVEATGEELAIRKGMLVSTRSHWEMGHKGLKENETQHR